MPPLRIAVTGPESTGKSALCKALATHFGTLWVPEYARSYLGNRLPPYTPDDLDHIAKGQTASENRYASQVPDLLFCDTEMTVMKVWSEHAFGKTSAYIEDLYNKQQYTLYLLADIDLPWEPDPLREHPHLRRYFFERYKHLLETSHRPFRIVSGLGEERFQMAIRCVEDILGE